MYYVYRHIRLDKNEPFYIGIGKKRYTCGTFKQEFYRAHEKNNRTDFWKSIAKNGYKIEILAESNDKDFICNKEKEFIELYGFKKNGGSLCNLTTGGEHTELTLELRQAISKRMMGNKNGSGQILDEERKMAISKRTKGNTIWRGRKHREESKLLISISKKGKLLSDSHRASLIGTRPHQKSIICETTGVKYNSICECVRKMFGWNRAIKNSISKICNGRLASYKGYNFKFV